MTTLDHRQAHRLPPEDFPLDGDAVIVTSYREATEILRSQDFRTGYGENSLPVKVAETGDVTIDHGATRPTCPVTHHADGSRTVPWEDLFREGALLRAEGAEHMDLRRALNPLFVRDSHVWFREHVIEPTVERNLAEVFRSADAEGVVRLDLVDFAKRVFVQMAGALIGFDGLDSAAGVDALVELEARIDKRRMANTLPPGAELEGLMKDALAARQEFLDTFAWPSLNRRQRLVADVRAGTQDGGQLPRDFLTQWVTGAIPLDESAAVNLASQLLPNSVGTNTTILNHVVAELTSYFARYPERTGLRTDPDFLTRALRETLRLHSGGSGVLVRVALVDVQLSTGREIPAGARVAIVHDAVDRDAEIFAEDAEVFNPDRAVPAGIRPFGVAFGNGPHICIGLPLVLGQGGVSGVQVPFLKVLYEAGLEPDPTRPHRRREDPFRSDYLSQPIILTRAPGS